MSSPRQHTPGPWHAAGLHVAASKTTHLGLLCHHPVANVIFSSGDEINDIEGVASEQCFVESPGSITAEANALLIASAPELLAELERTEASLTAILCSRVIDSTTSTWLELRRNRDAIRSAIARATGGNAS